MGESACFLGAQGFRGGVFHSREAIGLETPHVTLALVLYKARLVPTSSTLEIKFQVTGFVNVLLYLPGSVLLDLLQKLHQMNAPGFIPL